MNCDSADELVYLCDMLDGWIAEKRKAFRSEECADLFAALTDAISDARGPARNYLDDHFTPSERYGGEELKNV